MTTKIRPLLKDVVDLLSCSHAFPDVPSTIVSLLLALLDSGARDASLTLHTSPHSFDVATASWPHGCDPVVDDLLAALSVLSCSVTIRTFAPYHEVITKYVNGLPASTKRRYVPDAAIAHPTLTVTVEELFRRVPVRFEQIRERLHEIPPEVTQRVARAVIPFVHIPIVVRHHGAVLWERGATSLAQSVALVFPPGDNTTNIHHEEMLVGWLKVSMTQESKKACLQLVYFNKRLVAETEEMFIAVQNGIFATYRARLQHLSRSSVSFVVLLTGGSSPHQIQSIVARAAGTVQRQVIKFPTHAASKPHQIQHDVERVLDIPYCSYINLREGKCYGPAIKSNVFSHVRVVGQAFGSVVLCYNPTTRLLMCIDQHAADERIRLELFQKHVRSMLRSDVLSPTPVRVAMPAVLVVALEKYNDAVVAWGWRVLPVGCAEVEVSAVPGLSFDMDPGKPRPALSADDIVAFMEDVRSCRGHFGATVPRVLLLKLVSRSCRGALMFNTAISHAQCEDLIGDLSETTHSLICSHGRRSVVPLFTLA